MLAAAAWGLKNFFCVTLLSAICAFIVQYLWGFCFKSEHEAVEDIRGTGKDEIVRARAQGRGVARRELERSSQRRVSPCSKWRKEAQSGEKRSESR